MKKVYKIKVNGKAFEVELQEVSSVEGTVESSTPKEVVSKAPSGNGQGEDIVAPMPGTIVDVKVSDGDTVEKGQIVAILEAMKMETEILAPNSGKVTSVQVTKGAQVNLGDTIVSIA